MEDFTGNGVTRSARKDSWFWGLPSCRRTDIHGRVRWLILLFSLITNAALLFGLAPIAEANQTYTYTGNNFNQVRTDSGLVFQNINSNVTGTISLNIPSNFSGNILYNSFNNGNINSQYIVNISLSSTIINQQFTLTSATSYWFIVLTIANGALVNWEIQATNNPCFCFPENVISTENTANGAADDEAEVDIPSFVRYEVNSNPAKWVVAPPPSFDVVDASAFLIFYTGDNLSNINNTLIPTGAPALSSGGTPKLSVPADGGGTNLLLRLNGAGSGIATFQINGTGNATVDGQLYNPVAGGSPAPGEALPVQTINGQAFAFYQSPSVYTNQRGDMSRSHSLTVTVQAGGQNLTQALTIYRPNPPTLLSQNSKALFRSIGASAAQVAEAYDNASMIADGPSKLALNIAISEVSKVAKKILEQNDQIFGPSLEYALGIMQFLTNLSKSAKTNPISAVLEGLSLIFKGASIGANAIGIYDPPDSNYTTVAPPSALSFPSVGNATIDGVIADYLNYLSLSAAALHATERWQGAYLAGDAASQALQQNAFNQYSAQAATAQAKLTPDNAILQANLQVLSLASWPTAATDIAAAYNAQCGQPLPSDLNALLLTLAPQATIDSLVCSIGGSVKPSDINFDFSSLLSVPVPPPSSLVAAVLPSSRSVQLGNTATAFATIINTASTTAPSCAIAPLGTVPANFTYQTTNPTTNALTGSVNTPVDIAGGAAQSFVIALSPTGSLDPATVAFSFSCGGAALALPQTGVNTLLLSSSLTPVPDIVALAATASNDGILHIPGASGANAFAVATVDVGAGAAITASANTGGVTLPLVISLCQTNPSSGQCLAPPSPSVTTTINAGATPTFGIFATASGSIPFDPANNRIFVQFADQNGVTRGSTSVAVQTQ